MDWTSWLKQFGRYIGVMLLQVFLFDQLQFFGLCHPYIYVLCLLMMPITLRHSADLCIGAVAGLVMDLFSNSLGIHMAACVLIMFVRRYLLSFLVNEHDRLNEQISLRAIGLIALLEYTVILVLLHHGLIFLLSAWSWHYIGMVILETLISSIVTVSVIIGFNALRYR